MCAMLTADWILVGRDSYYRKLEVYAMNWQSEVNLENVLLTAAPNGGPIAIVRDPKKFVQIHGAGKSVIMIYSGSGYEMGSILWNNGVLVAMSWSESEQLICVQEDGSVLLFDMFGNFEHKFSMKPESTERIKVIDAKIFTNRKITGVAILTTKLKVYLVTNIKEPKLRTLSEIVPSNQITSSSLKWSVVFDYRSVEVIAISRGCSDIFKLTTSDTIACSFPKPTTNGNAVDLAVSPDGHELALFTDNGYLYFGKVDLDPKYCREIELDKKTPPRQMVWCGSDAVVCYWSEMIVIVNRSDGQTTTLLYDIPLHLVLERDGIRILSAAQHELLQKVPLMVQDVLRINSTEVGCYLLEASKHYEKRSHRADEYIALAKDDLGKAVEQCIAAASFEFDKDVQKMLMRAAQFGKCFLNKHDPTSFVNMCRELRVLNAVRDPRIGIAITHAEMQAQTYQLLLDRLVARRHYYLAIQVAKFLKIPEVEGASRILVTWACCKVKQRHQEWHVLAKEIADKLGYSPGISYDFVAKQAADAGNKKLAIKLLDFEPCARKQVPLLLKLGEDKPALEKAIASGDTDLVYDVLFYTKINASTADFSMTIRNYPMAQALYIKYCKERNTQDLFKIYDQEDDHRSQALLYLQQTFKSSVTESPEMNLMKAYDQFKIAKDDLNASFCDEAQRLYKHQKMLNEKIVGENFLGKSVHETLARLLQLREEKLADKLKSEYKIPDRRYWWLKIQIFAEKGNWLELERFSKSKKSPIGYGPFVSICLKYKKPDEAMKYLPKVDEKSKFKFLVRAERYEEAVELAIQQKYMPGLLFLQGKCRNNAVLSEKIRAYLREYEAVLRIVS